MRTNFFLFFNAVPTELKLNNEQKIVGKIRSIHGFAPKSWDKYAIHALEPIIQLIPNRGKY